MIISKLYNNTRSGKTATTSNSASTANSVAIAAVDKRNSIGDPRVITPSSIPIFILPPTLDSYANGNKPDLNDSYDCWSLQGDDNNNNNMNNIAYNQKQPQQGTTNQVAPKPSSQPLKQPVKSSTTTTTSQKPSSPSQQPRAASSLENLNKLDIVSPKSSGVRNASISSTSSTPNPHSDYYQNYTELQKKQQQQQQPQQQSSKECSKSRVKTLFRNGFLNLQTVNNENDEIKSKENYCNMWLLQQQQTGATSNNLPNTKDPITTTTTTTTTTNSDGAKRSRSNVNLNNAANTARSSSTNLSIASKSPSINFAAVTNNTTNTTQDKTEEQMQREYLVNLLLQLQHEQQNNTDDNEKNEKANNNTKKSKRSKSETLATLNAIWAKSGGPIGMATSTAAMLNTMAANNQQQQQQRRASSSKRSKSNSSQNRLNSIEKQNSGKSKTNRFLEVINGDNSGVNGIGADQRRFSLRNFFSFKPFNSSSARSSQSHLNKRNSEPENYLLQLLHQENQKLEQQNLLMNIMSQNGGEKPAPPKIVNNSVSNSSSVTSNSIIPPVNSVTGSVLKFNRVKLNDRLDSGDNSCAPRTLSDTNVNRIRLSADNSLRLPNDNDFSNRLSLLDRRELYKCSKSTSSTNQLDDDDNMDKIFNQYTTSTNKVSTGSVDRNNHYFNQSQTSTDFDNPNQRLPRRFFSFMFKSKHQQQPPVANPNRSSLRSKFKFFSRRSKTKRSSANNADQFEMLTSAAALAKKNSLNSNFKFDLHNLNLNDIEKDFLKLNNAANSNNRGKSASMVSNHSIYLDANLIVPNRIKKSRSTLPDLKSEYASAAAGFLFRNSSNKAVINAIVDVSIEKLQQSLNGGHLLSISLKNFRTEPLIEINHIKAKFNYLSIELVESKSMDLIEKHKHTSNGQLLAKINKIKSKKCKFDNNLKSFSKPVDFDLVDEHFLAVTEEATNLQMKKINAKQRQQSNELNDDDSGFSSQKKKSTSFETTATVNPVEPKRTYLFLFSIEVHSYLPVSRKILISTFRKKKRIFKGQCQIHENFIHSTQFTKQFLLTEV